MMPTLPETIFMIFLKKKKNQNQKHPMQKIPTKMDLYHRIKIYWISKKVGSILQLNLLYALRLEAVKLWHLMYFM